MNYKYDDRSFKGIEKMSFQLHCPARQLQRIMNEFEKQGVVKKTGKGAYKLIEIWISDQFPIGIALEIDIWEIRCKASVIKLAGAFLMEVWLKNEGCSNYS